MNSVNANWSSRCVGVGCTALLSVIFFGACSTSGKRSQVQELSNQLREGEYLREDYIRALCESLSPLHATRPDGAPQLIIVEKDKEGTSFMPVANFHEGDDLYRPLKNGRLRKIHPDGFEESLALFSLRVHGKDAFSLLDGERELQFRFVGKAERWVSDALIAGTYQDDKGGKYVFGANGQASFPGGRHFDYMLAMDHVLTNYDYLYSKDLNASLAVEINRKELSLREISGDFSEETISPTPKWRLARMTPFACK